VVITPAGKCENDQQEGERQHSPGNLTCRVLSARVCNWTGLGRKLWLGGVDRGQTLHPALTQCFHVIRECLFFIEPDVTGVGPNETLVENAPRQLLELLFLEGAQHTRTDLGAQRDIIERDAALLAFFLQPVTKRSHALLLQGGAPGKTEYSTYVKRAGRELPAFVRAKVPSPALRR